MAFIIPAVLGVSSLSGLVGWAVKRYYFTDSSPKAPQPEIEDFEYIKRDEEALQEERAKIMELADKVFISTSENTVTYDYDKLVQGGAIDSDTPYPFEGFRNTPYLRRCKQIGEIFNYVLRYEREVHKFLIDKELGIKRLTPALCLQAKLAEKDPVALQISAMLFQLGDDAEMLPPIPKHIDLSFLDGRAVAIPHKVGQIDIQGLNQFTITDDLIVIEDMDKTFLGAYTVNRTVTIGSPNADGSVKCKIERVFQRFNPVHEG